MSVLAVVGFLVASLLHRSVSGGGTAVEGRITGLIVPDPRVPEDSFPAAVARRWSLPASTAGEARIVERAFGLGASVLVEAAQYVSERLALDAA